MEVVGAPNISVGSVRWLRASGVRVATIVAKTTYRLLPGECQLCERADPVVENDRYVDGDASGELSLASDLVPRKARVDVMVVGSAYAHVQQNPSVIARFAIGMVEKSVELRADWASQETASVRGEAVTRVPLAYDRSVAPPVGMGPISPNWASRRALWTVGGEPTSDRFIDAPLVESIDPRFFNAAPEDQQLELIRPGERLILENLSPSHRLVQTALPKTSPRVTTNDGRELELCADTLLIDSDREVFSMTWRAELELPAGSSDGLIAHVALERGGPARTTGPRFPHVVSFTDEATADEPTAGEQAAVSFRGKPSTLPFRARENQAPPWIAEPTSSPNSRPGASSGPSVAAAASSFGLSPAPPLPFAAPPPIAAPAHPSPHFVVPASAPPVSTVATGPVARSVSPVAAPSAFQAGLGGSTPPERVATVGHAVAPGTAASSNAAAEAEASASPRGPITQSSAASIATHAPIDLVWFSKEALPRMRVFYKSLLADLAFESFDSKHEVPSDDPEFDKGRHEVFGVLTHETSLDPAVASSVLVEAIDKMGRFTPPLAVFEAELRPRFSVIARLQAALSLVGPVADVDPKMKELVERATLTLAREHPNAGGAATRQLAALRDHFIIAHGKPAGGTVFDTEVEHVLVDERAFDERTLLGQKQLVFQAGADAQALPMYAHPGLRDALPMFESFRARFIAEIHPRLDRAESASVALRMVALARTIEVSKA